MKNSTFHMQSDKDGFNELRVMTRFLLLLALLTGLLYLRVFFAKTFSAEIAPDQKATIVLALLSLIGAITGILATWRWARLGGITSMICGLLLAILTYLMSPDNPWLTALFYSSPFIITGGLSLISSRTTQNTIP